MIMDLAPYGVGKDTETLLTKELAPFAEPIAKWRGIAESIVITDESQLPEMKKARELRLEIRGKRTAVEKIRKELKDESLRYGRAVDGVAKTIMEAMSSIESDLTEKERFAEIQQEKREKEIESSRFALLSELGEYSFLTDLGKWTEDRFNAYLDDQKALVAVRREQERKAAEEEAARLNEAKLLREENERIQAEAKAEAARLHAELDAERKRVVEIERQRSLEEAQARAAKAADEEAVRKAEAKRLAEEKKAAAAPDKEKLLAFAASLSGIEIPTMSTEDGIRISEAIGVMIGKMVNYVNEHASAL